jgi:hypothetical protein
MLLQIHIKSPLLLLIPALNMLDGDDCAVWGSRWISGRFADSIRVFLLGQIVCAITLDFVKDHSSVGLTFFVIKKYQGCDNEFESIVKSMSVTVCDVIAQLERIIENLMNLRHPCISCTIGEVLRSPLQELHIIRQCSVGGSLSEVISTSPEWWTPTARVTGIVGIVLSM